MKQKQPQNMRRDIGVELTGVTAETDIDGIVTLTIKDVQSLDVEAYQLRDILNGALKPSQIDGILDTVWTMNRLNALENCIRGR